MKARELDGAMVVRAASRGFTVLLLGGVVQPWVTRFAPVVGYWWLAIVAVVAFTMASGSAVRRAPTRPHLLQGALAALSSYLLVVPLVLHVAGGVPWLQLVCTAATALVVGVLVQVVVERGATRRTPQRGSQLPPGAEAAGPARTTASR